MRYKLKTHMGFSPGHVVKVTHPLRCYTTFYRMVRLLNLQNWNEDYIPVMTVLYVITHIEKHIGVDSGDVYVIVIKSLEDSKEYIMGPNGLERYEI